MCKSDTPQPEAVASETPEIRQIGPGLHEATTKSFSAVAFRVEANGSIILLVREGQEEEDKAELLRQIEKGEGKPLEIRKQGDPGNCFTRFTLPDSPAVFVILAAHHGGKEGGAGNE